MIDKSIQVIKASTIGDIYSKLNHIRVKKRENFKEANNEKMICLKCSYCNNDFGMDNSFVEKYIDSNIIYTCPYCQKEGRIDS